MKTCSKCEEKKPITDFYADKRTKDGKRSACKNCINSQNKDYINRDREKYLEYQRSQYLKNRENRLKQRKDYYKSNREDILEYHKNHIREKRRQDPCFRLVGNLRNGLYKSLKGYSKKHRTMKYVGCSIEQLWIRFESLFQDGMTRENYGEWHVDHIQPLCSFDFTGEDQEDQLKRAWHYSNLQPLWAIDNQKKSGLH